MEHGKTTRAAFNYGRFREFSCAIVLLQELNFQYLDIAGIMRLVFGGVLFKMVPLHP